MIIKISWLKINRLKISWLKISWLKISRLKISRLKISWLKISRLSGWLMVTVPLNQNRYLSAATRQRSLQYGADVRRFSRVLLRRVMPSRGDIKSKSRVMLFVHAVRTFSTPIIMEQRPDECNQVLTRLANAPTKFGILEVDF